MRLHYPGENVLLRARPKNMNRQLRQCVTLRRADSLRWVTAPSVSTPLFSCGRTRLIACAALQRNANHQMAEAGPLAHKLQIVSFSFPSETLAAGLRIGSAIEL